jgi:hypothetical protein
MYVLVLIGVAAFRSLPIVCRMIRAGVEPLTG